MGMRIALVILLTVATQNALAVPFSGEAPTSKAEYCAARKNTHYFRGLAHNIDNHMTLRNHGGLFNGGVCWWHNLFQRSAIYLSVFRPELPKPDKANAKKIIHAIAAGKRVVEIPGYTNMTEFSNDWKNEIQAKLEAWQREDGFLKFAWIQGISGGYETDPNEIRKTLNYVLDRSMNHGEIHWTMWQVKGISSHASINLGGSSVIIDYKVNHIDSNYPRAVRAMSWTWPNRSIDSYFGKFVPYVYRKSDLSDFKKAGDSYCATRSYDPDFPRDPLKNTLDQVLSTETRASRDIIVLELPMHS